MKKKFLFIFLFIFSCWIYKANNSSYIDNITINKIRTNRKLLAEEINKYVLTYSNQTDLDVNKLIKLADKYSIDIKFILAQSHIESHFGTKGLASKTNSMFNVGSYDGVSYDCISKKFKYENINESIEPYLILLTERYLKDKTIHDLMDNFVDINNKRYASDENYELKLKTTYNKISKNTKIDSLYLCYMESKSKFLI